jgi:hypothetical protein
MKLRKERTDCAIFLSFENLEFEKQNKNCKSKLFMSHVYVFPRFHKFKENRTIDVEDPFEKIADPSTDNYKSFKKALLLALMETHSIFKCCSLSSIICKIVRGQDSSTHLFVPHNNHINQQQ